MLDFSYHQNFNKRIGMDVSTQNIQVILNNLIIQKKLKKNDNSKMFPRQQKAILNFYLDSLTITERYKQRTSKNNKSIE